MESDHRELGRELELFATTPAVGAGLPLWLPDGAIIRAELEKLAAEEAARSGCTGVYTPVLAKRSLFEQSGHWAKFSTDMFPEIRISGEDFVLRPANCPHHTQVYASRGRSYRDLPIRLSELGSMFRSELSGVLGGLNRVRQISLDDAHVFCPPFQVHEEVRRALDAIERAYSTLGIDDHHFRLSKRGSGNQYLGDMRQWDDAERQLRSALDEVGVDYVETAGEAAFYGPKIDVQVKDARGREETLSTVQLDFNQPERFGLQYTGEDGQAHRPVMIHRGVLGSMERMVALLIERYDGRMPPWLAPRQVAVLPVGDIHRGAADKLHQKLLEVNLRAEVVAGGSLGSRIRTVRVHRDPYIAVLGAAEDRDGTVNLTVPKKNTRSINVAVDRFVSGVAANVASRSVMPELFQ